MKLLHYNEYWKKRYTVRWTKFGDGSTKFFQAAAAERYRISTITSLESENDRVATDHHEKAAILLDAYKARMGTASRPKMYFNLNNLVRKHNNLDQLSAPFDREEIDKVVMQIPVDKALGPDGFSGLFIKKC